MISSASRSRLAATGLRIWGLGVRFVFILILARFLAVDAVGMYGLVSAAVAYAVYVIGLDMYTYTTRELIGADHSRWARLLRTHFGFIGAMLVLVLPLSLLLFSAGLLPWSMAPWFMALALTESLGTELDRALIAMSEQFWASVAVFIRQGLMPTIAIPVLAIAPEARTIEFVLATWIVFNLLALAMGLVVTRRKTQSDFLGERVGWRWIVRGLRICIPLFFATLCLKAMFTFDKQLVNYFGGLELAGVYTLAMGLAAGLTNIVAVGIHQFSYPKLIKHAKDSDQAAFSGEMRALLWQTAAVSCLALLAAALLTRPVLSWIGKPEYVEYDWLVVAAVAAVSVYNLSLVPHFALYAHHQDRAIVLTTTLATVLWAVIWFIALPLGVFQAALISLTSASFALGLGKLYFMRRYARSRDR